MNKKQYNNIIEHSLQYDCKETDSSLDTARIIFNNMGVALPQGDMKTVYETINTDNYMDWRKCTLEEAKEAADNGTAAIGISEDRILIFSAEDEEKPVLQTKSVLALADDTPIVSLLNLDYYSYRYGNTTLPTIYCSNQYLSLYQMQCNAQYILDYLRNYGWSKRAVCALLGNMQTESTINPGIWQSLDEGNMNVGFGLVQWTPASKYINWANANGYYYLNINSQLCRLIYEVNNNIQWISTSGYPLSFASFTTSNSSINYLTAAFMHNYERPGSYSTLSQRQSQAQYWYNNLY